MSLEDSFYLLHYNEDTVIQNLPGLSPDDEDGLEEAFTFQDEFNDPIQSGCWISSECFVYSTGKGSINYLIGSKSIKFSNCEKKQFILGYDQK